MDERPMNTKVKRLNASALIPSLAFLGLIMSLPAPALAQNFGRGQDLYKQHCESCHEDLLHTRNKKIKNLDTLRRRIQDWASHTGNTWSYEEIEDVLYYLNKSFYGFDQQPL